MQETIEFVLFSKILLTFKALFF